MLHEIVFVDDGSTDETAAIVTKYPVRCLRGDGRGPGAARNLGWRAAVSPIVWFIDSDCVAEPGALSRLLPHLDHPRVGGVGGSYSNLRSDSLLACLIHQEIVERHGSMPTEVNFLGTFNVAYRREVLERLGGFDERWVNGPGKPGAEDADLAYRAHKAGFVLRFERESRVGHYHPTSLLRYLRSQCVHGYWRVNLHLRHPHMSTGDAYSTMVDHAQPPLAMLTLAALPTLLFAPTRLVVPALLALLGLLQAPMTVRLVRRTGQWRYLAFAPLSIVRAFARGLGACRGILAALVRRPDLAT